MTAPQQPGPDGIVDDDPTGMGALLRGLPDPGPMPDELVRRIQVALAAEAGPLGRPGEGAYAPVLDLAAHRRRSVLRPVQWAAAAGLVAVAGGGFMLARSGDMMSALSIGGSHSAASVAADRAQAGSPAGAGSGPAGGIAELGTLPAGSVVVLMSNRSVGPGDLASAGQSALAGAGASLRDLASEAPSIGPIGTAVGARDCATALGVPSDVPVVVDLVSHEDAPAAVVVAKAPGGSTAYLVRRSCRLGSAELLVGPQAL